MLKGTIILIFSGILCALFSALFAFMRPTTGSNRVLYGLAWRIFLAIALFGGLVGLAAWGIVKPHPFGA